MTGELQHVNVKIFAEPGSRPDWPALIPVFHRWIQDETLPGLVLDVADYAHVPAGPGVMLIGHDAFYALDNRANRLGMLFNQRTATEGTAQEKLQAAHSAAVFAATTLEQEPELRGKVRFNFRRFEVFVNDRLLAPNNEATWQKLEPELRSAFGPDAELTWDSDPRGLFRVEVHQNK
jgi:hypothetical protein